MPIAPHPVDHIRYVAPNISHQNPSFLVRSAQQRDQRLQLPSSPTHIVLDTDTKNEIDDQFALVYALLSSEVVVEAVHAAPFVKPGYPTPAAGMEASYDEILTLFRHMAQLPRIPVYKGSRAILSDPHTPVTSDAATHLIDVAMKPRNQPLYVIAIGAITNVISAILLEPQIIEHIVVVWLGAHPTYWTWDVDAADGSRNHAGPTSEFNFNNDPIGAVALFDSGVPLIWIPCKNVAEHLRTVPAEIDRYVANCGDIGRYLASIFNNWVTRPAASKPLWDMSTIAYLINPTWVPTIIAPTPQFKPQTLRDPPVPTSLAAMDTPRPPCRMAIDVKRDPIFNDFFTKLASDKLWL
jgi:inosine-uridine nucleoside N-ribohydrolase